VSEREHHVLRRPGAHPVRTLAEYRRDGGYKALELALETLTPEQVIQRVQESGLHGRGGAGVPVVEKWSLVRGEDNFPKYVICNAYDADLGSRISRTLLEHYPHQVIEGIALAAYAVGAEEAYLFTRSLYTAGIAAAREALGEALAANLIGRSVLGSRFNCTITLVAVDVGFMGGEETTLMEIIKGRRAMPQQRPPYPAIVGLWDKPTAINSVETLANVPMIVAHGGAKFHQGVTDRSPGTKLLTIYGPEPGTEPRLIEVELGTTVRQAVRHAGMTLNEREVRGVVVGGPEGGVLPPSLFDTPIDYDALEQAGTILGSGTVEVLPAKTCMVAWANGRMEYLSHQSCGKCVPCRLGVKRIAGTLETIISDLGALEDLKLLEEFAEYVPNGSLCGFGVHAPHALVSAMRYFPDDFRLHVEEQRCPTGTCVPLRVHRFVKKHVL
jgi:NADH:ubiquinone oxidoreductase subunit F (NADH-binding)